MRTIIAIMLLALSCSCASNDSLPGKRITTDTFDAVAPTRWIPVKTVKEIEAGIVEYTINTIRTNNPRAYSALSKKQLLDLRKYKRQYFPVFQEGDRENVHSVIITLVFVDIAEDFNWLKTSLLGATDGWISLLTVRYDLDKKEFISAHAGGIS